jgi:hypothetical protein
MSVWAFEKLADRKWGVIGKLKGRLSVVLTDMVHFSEEFQGRV